MQTKLGLFQGIDVQVTHSAVNQSRSESAIAVNPLNPLNLIATSKKFIDPKKYHFTVSTAYSMDGGSTWLESPLPPSGWDGMTDPSVAFDSQGNAFVVVEPLEFTSTDIKGMGMYVFKSADGGKSWSGPTALHAGDSTDDKQWIACDNSPTSFYYGNIYVAWGASSPLRFARSIDHGQSWKGKGNEPSGSVIHSSTFAPEISVGDDGTIHIVWHIPGDSTIEYMRSTDGGESFEDSQAIVQGMKSLYPPYLPQDPGESFPHLPNSQFRVLTLVTGCALPSNRFMVAWADMAEGVARIYYRLAEQNGATWTGAARGRPLLPSFPANEVQHFHPQVVATKAGVIGCAFYEFGHKGTGYRIDTRIAGSFTLGYSFEYLTTVTDAPWDPAVNAPWSHGDPDETFIGEYFGLDADDTSFVVLWTDTRSGIQELFFDRVKTSSLVPEVYGYPLQLIHWPYPDPVLYKELLERMLAGSVKDGSGFIIANGRVTEVPARGPKLALLQSMAALDGAEQIGHASGARVVRAIAETIGEIAKDLVKEQPGKPN